MRRDQALPNAENRNSRNERNRSFTKLKQRTVIAAVIIVALVAVISTRPEHTVLTVQPARASELVRDGDVLPADDSGVRPIATVLGTTVRPNKWGLSATLVEVRSGSTREIAGHGVSDGLTYLGRPLVMSTNRIHRLWQHFTRFTSVNEKPEVPIRFELELRSMAGSRISLRSSGTSRSGGWAGGRPGTHVPVPNNYRKNLSTPLKSDRDYIIYAEGSTDFELGPSTTLAEFASQNTGHYLVVTARLNLR